MIIAEHHKGNFQSFRIFVYIMISLCVHGIFLLLLSSHFKAEKQLIEQRNNIYISIATPTAPRKMLLNPPTISKPVPESPTLVQQPKLKPQAMAHTPPPVSQPQKTTAVPIQKADVSLKEFVNPFGPLPLPNAVLGQGLFPRKYKIIFKVIDEDADITEQNMELFLQSFLPLQPKEAYIDDLVRKTFEKQLSHLSKITLKSWLNNLQKQNDKVKTKDDNLYSITLEFHESNV